MCFFFNVSPESFRWPNVGKYKVNVASFESLALPELQVRWFFHCLLFNSYHPSPQFNLSFGPSGWGFCYILSGLDYGIWVIYILFPISYQVKEDIDLFIIDEVGKMELYSSSFFPAVLKVLESNIPLLASVPIPKFGRDIPGGTFSSFFLTMMFWLFALSAVTHFL